MNEKTVNDDPFMGITKGCLVRIDTGPDAVVGKDALVIGRELITLDHGEDSIEDWDANIDVLVDGRKVGLWVGWVTKIVD